MWASTLLLGPWPNSARRQPKIAFHLGHIGARHVLGDLPAWQPCTGSTPPLPTSGAACPALSSRGGKAEPLSDTSPFPRALARSHPRSLALAFACCSCGTAAMATAHSHRSRRPHPHQQHYQLCCRMAHAATATPSDRSLLNAVPRVPPEHPDVGPPP
jgi:hypothetical protein